MILLMHNTLVPKDYTVLESYAWKCVCNSCHQKLHPRKFDPETGRFIKKDNSNVKSSMGV
jgi:hypothetical protein